MVTTFPSVLPSPHSGIPVSFPQPKRKRGGQPGNSNAFRHGLYSAHSVHTPEVPLQSSAALKDPTIPLKDLQDRLVASGKRELCENRYKLVHCLAVSKGGLPLNKMLSQVRAVTIIIGKNLKIRRSLFELGIRQAHLGSLVRDLPALLRWEFSEMGIPVQPAFVPQKLVNLHANLGWEAPHLTDTQWELLQETFVSLRADLDYFRKYHRRTPLPFDRFLL